MLSEVEWSEMELKATRNGALATECREHSSLGACLTHQCDSDGLVVMGYWLGRLFFG
jgi:hypothetical protein